MKKYKYLPFNYIDRKWPNKSIKEVPIWCSVDLRDGNQALINPMNLFQKVKLFKYLVAMGFKEIEIGFPAASQTEYDFLRYLINESLIPDDVTIQVLTQAREKLIKKTMESIIGAKNVIVHLYNSTSINQRKIVFEKSKEEIIDIAVQGVKWIKAYKTEEHQNIILQYSPESFTGTEITFSLKICEAVFKEWNSKEKVIMNLPATVELFGPHIYADMIEWFCHHFSERNRIIVSLHTHNDRGTGVAATELGLLAGADRVEGTLFGNGERTGNVDIVNVALNMYTHGLEPKLNVFNIEEMVKIFQETTEMTISKRHPYAGDLVFTAFSGSHQDAIKKGFTYQKQHPSNQWEVPYLPIDPQDIGRTYEAIIRINSQSGKSGLAYVMEDVFGYQLPKNMQIEFSHIIQEKTDKEGKEILADEIFNIFEEIYLKQTHSIIKYLDFIPRYLNTREVQVKLSIAYKTEEDEKTMVLEAIGNGPIDASIKALEQLLGNIKLLHYSEHTLSKTSNADAIAYIQLKKDKQTHFGVGIDNNITVASIKALVSAINFYL